MIALILKSYATLFVSIGIGSILIFCVGLYWIFNSQETSLDDITDFSAIAGDDLIATQLDLARAYIETNNKPLAKKILNDVIHQGSRSQKQEARILLGLI
jgi:FimV-like protein